ncbi:MAG: hypothetical protein Q7J34_02390 [Bacteroidales bacterium]|jgi:hypothetical protein|nr:hypothetical protein [Bacteroidales bacterium]
MEKGEKPLMLTLDEARVIYLSTKKMGEILEKDILRKKGNEAYDMQEDMDNLKTIHQLTNKMGLYINEFLINIGGKEQ